MWNMASVAALGRDRKKDGEEDLERVRERQRRETGRECGDKEGVEMTKGRERGCKERN